ncbi:hypothetical protein MKX01_029136, partial [Papaver californicum]
SFDPYTVRYLDTSLENCKQEEITLMKKELRCLKSLDHVQSLADNLPFNTIYLDVTIKCKVVIGCDGVNSVVSDFIELKSTRSFSTCGVRGFSNYLSDNLIFCRTPVNENRMYWFVGLPWRTSRDLGVSSETNTIKQATVRSIMDYPPYAIEIAKK